MAGDWIRIRVDLIDDPAVLGISAALDVTPHQVVGHLVAFWGWASRQSRDGHARVTLLSHVDRIAGVTGFAEALIGVGWLQRDEGGICIPNWERHLSQSAKDRALAAERQRSKRARDVTDPSRSRRDEPVTREEKRRGEKEEPPKTPPKGGDPTSSVGTKGAGPSKTRRPPWRGEIPLALDGSEEFRALWAEWLRYRREEIRKPVGQISGDRALEQCAGWGVARSIAALKVTMASGWTGLREPELPRRSGAGGAPGVDMSVDEELRRAGLVR